MSSTASSSRGVAVVIGVGPGLGASLARKFAAEGFVVGLIARRAENLKEVQTAIEKNGGKALSIPADASDEQSLRKALQHVKSEFGDVTVLIHNAGAFQPGGVNDIKPEQLNHVFNIGVTALLTAAQEVVPSMQQKKSGTILVTGATASLRGGAKFIGLSVPKAALRNLSQSLARELQPQGIHVAHFIIDGGILGPRTKERWPDKDDDLFLNPDRIADTYYHVQQQDKTAWTHELELRPYGEKW